MFGIKLISIIVFLDFFNIIRSKFSELNGILADFKEITNFNIKKKFYLKLEGDDEIIEPVNNEEESLKILNDDKCTNEINFINKWIVTHLDERKDFQVFIFLTILFYLIICCIQISIIIIGIGNFDVHSSISPFINTISDSILFFLLYCYGIFYYFFMISFNYNVIVKNLKILEFHEFSHEIIQPTILGVQISPTILISLGLFNILPISLNIFNVLIKVFN
jgi:hypothetical protein